MENGGIATRDFIYVDDIVERPGGLRRARAPVEVYNLASGTETSILELAEHGQRVDRQSRRRSP